MMTLKRLIKFYRCENSEEFFQEMTNCLELSHLITINDYQDYLESFISNHRAWSNQ